MLVLSRCKNETIVIGDNIRVTVVDIRKTTIRLGIEAPDSTEVHRKEVYDIIHKKDGSIPITETRQPLVNSIQ